VRELIVERSRDEGQRGTASPGLRFASSGLRLITNPWVECYLWRHGIIVATIVLVEAILRFSLDSDPPRDLRAVLQHPLMKDGR
jgi:hypothetical protein